MFPGMKRLGAWARVAIVAALPLAMGALSCTTNHDALAKQPKAGSGGGGGAAGAVAGGGFGNTGDVPSQGGRINPDQELPGDDVLTIVNGVIDAPSVALCFGWLSPDGQDSELVGSPSAELEYGHHAVLTELEELSFEADAIVPWVIAGDLSLLDGLDCEAAVALALDEEASVTPEEPEEPAESEGAAGAGGAGSEPEPDPLPLPALRARALAAVPAGTVAIGRSILMVLTGCMGGAAFTDSVERAACGPDYTPSTPTLEPLVVKMSRKYAFEKVGLQAVLASPSVNGTIDVRAAEEGSLLLTFASDVSFGNIEPRPADVRYGPLDLGVTTRRHGLEAVDDNGVLFEQKWPRIFQASGLSELVAARNYTAVLLGPNPRLAKDGFWNASTFALVESDPTRD